MTAATISKQTTLERRTGDPSSSADDADDSERRLRLAFLGCENKPPYGPNEHTAQLFLELVAAGWKEKFPETSCVIQIVVYQVQNDEYPSSYDDFDGVILPGSFSGAYQDDEWIQKLKKVIRENLYEPAIPTLGVCFGHQVYAHAFQGGKAMKCPAGPQGGCQMAKTTTLGETVLGSSTFDLLYTHGDMVQNLPEFAEAIGGNENVPVESAIYFHSGDKRKVVAVTFQAHPEYAASDLGYEKTFLPILAEMEKRGDLSKEARIAAVETSNASLDSVKKQSIKAMIVAGEQLGWFK